MEYAGTGGAASIDLIAAGATVDLQLESGARYVLTMTWPGESPEVTSGGWSTSGDVMTLTEDGMPFSRQFDCLLEAGVLHLGGADAEWDFDADGTAEPATLSLDLVR